MTLPADRQAILDRVFPAPSARQLVMPDDGPAGADSGAALAFRADGSDRFPLDRAPGEQALDLPGAHAPDADIASNPAASLDRPAGSKLELAIHH
jgi:hypothetical protein